MASTPRPHSQAALPHTPSHRRPARIRCPARSRSRIPGWRSEAAARPAGVSRCACKLSQRVDVERPVAGSAGQSSMRRASSGRRSRVHAVPVPPGPGARTPRRAAVSDVSRETPGTSMGCCCRGTGRRGHAATWEGRGVDAVKGHGTAEDLIARSAHQHIGQRALARAVGARDGVDLTRCARSGSPPEDIPTGFRPGDPRCTAPPCSRHHHRHVVPLDLHPVDGDRSGGGEGGRAGRAHRSKVNRSWRTRSGTHSATTSPLGR